MVNVGDGILSKITKVVIETDEENPRVIAELTADDVYMAEGYRVRMTPNYDE